jgi:hypothetical protein
MEHVCENEQGAGLGALGQDFAAIMLKVFPRFSALNKVQITSIIDRSEIEQISLWIHSQYPLTPTTERKIETSDQFEYFVQKNGSE